MHELLECMSLGFGNPPASTLCRLPQYHDHVGVQEHARSIVNHKEKAEKLRSYFGTYGDPSRAITETTHYVS